MQPGTAPPPLEGTFWQIDTPQRQVPGQLTVAPAPVLETLGPIFDERAYRVEVKQQRLLATSPKPVTDDDLAEIFTRSMELW